MTIVKGTGVAARNRKSTGDQTFYQLRGQTVQRERVTPRNPNTLDQQKVRRRMAEGDVLYGMFAEAVNVGLHPPKRLWTPENYFKHMNSTEGRIEVDDELNVTVHFEEVVCARGKVRLVDGMTVKLDAGTRTVQLELAPETTEGWRRQMSDRVYALVGETVQMDAKLVEVGTRGEGGSTSVTLRQRWDPEKVVVYVFATTADGKRASNSEYVVPEPVEGA